MKYTQLNKNWNADPIHPNPEITITEQGLELSFALNLEQNELYEAGDKGTLKFVDVFAYRLEKLNQEAFEQGNFRYSKEQLPWGACYEINGSNWQSDFPKDKLLVNEQLDSKKLKHFIFFLGEQIFECLAYEFRFFFDFKLMEALELKYPKGYFNHYFSLFSTLFKECSANNFRMFTDLYIQLEGKKEFKSLKEELNLLKQNNELDVLLKIALNFGVVKFGKKQLQEMIREIETFKG